MLRRRYTYSDQSARMLHRRRLCRDRRTHHQPRWRHLCRTRHLPHKQTATRSPAPTPTTETPADSAKTASIAAIQSSGIGTILADSDGNTLYLFTNDESSMSNCSGGCAGAWPPLLTVGDPQPEEV